MKTHEQYKRDGKTYTTWLIRTAREAGYSGPIVYNTEGNITTKTISDLSQWIGNQSGITVILPRSVWHAFKRTVKLRKRYAEWHAKEKPEETMANAGHSGFINVLEQSASNFWGSVQVQPVAKQSDDQVISGTTPLSFFNAFSSLLDEEEPDDSELEDEPLDEKIPNESRKASDLVVDQPKAILEEELDFERFCYMQDVLDCLDYVEQTFQGEDNERPDIRITTFIANAAIELVKGGEENVLGHGSSINSSDLVNKYCINSKLGQGFESVSDIHQLPRKGYPFPLEFLQDRKGFSVDEKWADDDQHLAEIIMEVYLEGNVRRQTWEKAAAMNQMGYHQPLSRASLDEASRVFLALLDGNNPTVVTAFAADILLRSIPDTKERWEEPLSDLLNAARSIDKSISEARSAGVSFPLAHKKAMDKCLSLLDWILRWPLQDHRYIHLRNLNPEHPLSGIHRDIWKHLNMPIEQKAALIEYVKNKPDRAGSAVAFQTYANMYYLPNTDPDYLRKANPLVSGQLYHNLSVRNEEIGLGKLNATASVFSMCHQYNALRQTGRLQTRWPIIESMIKIHMKKLFLTEIPTELPTEPGDMYDRLLLSAGVSYEVVTNTKKSRARGEAPTESIFKQSKTKTWNLEPSPMTLVLRDYFDEKPDANLRRTLSRLDAEMQKKSGDKRSKSLIDDLGWVPFLKELEKTLSPLMARLDIDYITLSRVCSGLFQQMEKSMGSPGDSEVVPEERGLGIAMSVLGEIDNAEGLKNAGGKIVETPLSKIAQTVMEVYLKSGEKGNPAYGLPWV